LFIGTLDETVDARGMYFKFADAWVLLPYMTQVEEIRQLQELGVLWTNDFYIF
jgi:hypothetical protein